MAGHLSHSVGGWGLGDSRGQELRVFDAQEKWGACDRARSDIGVVLDIFHLWGENIFCSLTSIHNYILSKAQRTTTAAESVYSYRLVYYLVQNFTKNQVTHPKN